MTSARYAVTEASESCL